MKYTVRFAHLSAVFVKEGDAVNTGDVIGRMGNTGQSTGAHLHIDCVNGDVRNRYTLADVEAGTPESALRELNYFIDDDLFKTKLKITTYYGEPDYQKAFKKLHCGYDVIPLSGDCRIYWNRSAHGKVTNILHEDAGYGNCVYVCFET
jgi:hypothetical protein